MSLPQPSFSRVPSRPSCPQPPLACPASVFSSAGSADIYGRVEWWRSVSARVGLHGCHPRVLPRWPSGQGQGGSRGPQESRRQSTFKVGLCVCRLCYCCRAAMMLRSMTGMRPFVCVCVSVCLSSGAKVCNPVSCCICLVVPQQVHLQRS